MRAASRRSAALRNVITPANDKVAQRARETGDDWQPTGFPVQFLSLGTGGNAVSLC